MVVSVDMSITTTHLDLVFLISPQSTETTSVTSWGEFTPTLKDVSMMFRLPILGDDGAIGLALSDKEKAKVQLLSAALRLSKKSTYTSWARYWYF